MCPAALESALRGEYDGAQIYLIGPVISFIKGFFMIVQKTLYWSSVPLVNSYAGAMLKMDVHRQAQFPAGAKIIAANHPSTTDPFFVAALVGQQSFILINNTLFKVPVLGEYLRRSGHIPVIEGRGQEAIDAGVEHLRAGHTVMIFPEGTISPREGGFAKARTGVARLALASNAPVIPLGIHLLRERIHSIVTKVDGQDEVGYWYLRGPYTVTIGRPLYYRGSLEDRPHVRWVAENVMHQIIEMARLSENRFNRASGMFSGALEPLG